MTTWNLSYCEGVQYCKTVFSLLTYMRACGCLTNYKMEKLKVKCALFLISWTICNKYQIPKLRKINQLYMFHELRSTEIGTTFNIIQPEDGYSWKLGNRKTFGSFDIWYYIYIYI